MKVVVAIDSFKGCVSSRKAAQAARLGVIDAVKDAEVNTFEIADGGEGTMECLVSQLGGEKKECMVTGPLGEKIMSTYGIVNKNTAIIEMSAAAGITLVDKDKLNPLYATTYGVGELIINAMDRGCTKFIIGIGGSATNDGGTGMLMALGFEFLNGDGESIKRGAIGLSELVQIIDRHVDKRIYDCDFTVACDVENPLLGEYGCSRVFAPQKGADEEMIDKMDNWMSDYARLTKVLYKDANEYAKGAGAAGGLGFALTAYLNGRLENGINIVLGALDIEKYIKECDLVITGEGKIDSQTIMGKAPTGVSRIAKKYNKRCVAIAGIVGDGIEKLKDAGIETCFCINKNTESDNVLDPVFASNNIRRTVYEILS